MKKIAFFFRYIRYRLVSSNKHHIHSPFVFNLLTEVISLETPYYIFDKIEYLRSQLLLSQKEIMVNDFGSGVSGKRKIKDIARNAAKSKKYGQLLFRLVNYFKPKEILEMGSSLGISTLYLATPSAAAKVITMDGCNETAKVARENFQKFKIENIKIITGNFDETLPLLLKEQQQVDFVFYDGNHRQEPTLRYFETCLEKATEQSVFVFDDIHWSKEMEQAWKEIKKHPKVTVSIDLFFMGLVFFKKEQAPEHFVIKF